MDRLARLRANPRWLSLAKLFTELKALNGVAALFYLHRGVTIDQVFYLSVVWSVTTLLVEVPTGYLADRFGRKRTLLLGVTITCLAYVLAFFADSFLAFCFQFALMSFGFSCFSGTEEALLYDTLKETGDEQRMTELFAKLNAARQVMKIFVPSLGAWIARDLIESQFRGLVFIDILGSVVAWFFLSRVEEPRHAKDVSSQEKGIFKESLDTILHEPLLFRIALNKALVFIASFIAWRVYQPYWLAYGIAPVWFAVYYALMKSAETVTSLFLGRLEQRFSAERLATGALIMAIISFALMAILPNQRWLLFVTTWGGIFFSAIREPMFSHAMNSRIESRSRATTLSNLYVLKAVLDIPILLVSGWLALQDLRYVVVLALGLCLTAFVALPVNQRAKTASPETAR